MSHLSLPPELLDHVVDNLSLTRDSLKACCLVSKSWIPRTRRHLFANIEFLTPEHLQSWKNIFQNPSTSPARYTKALLVKHPCVVTTGDGGEDGWILAFSRVVRLEVDIAQAGSDGAMFSLVPFHGFSPALKSLHLMFLSFPSSQISDLVFSFPLLENLAVFTLIHHPADYDGFNRKLNTIKHSSSPAFTGALDLSLADGVNSVALPLLSLSNGLHFQELCLVWDHAQDASVSTALVKECSSTLEFLAIRSALLDESPLGSVDLSGTRKLKIVLLACRQRPQWAVCTLQTITPDNAGNLQGITLWATFLLHALEPKQVTSSHLRRAIGEVVYEEWLELDRLVVRLWESHPFLLRVRYNVPSHVDEQCARGCMNSLLPEVTARGIADFTSEGEVGGR